MKLGSTNAAGSDDDDSSSSSSSYNNECSLLSDKLEEIEFLKSQQLNVGHLFRSAVSRVASARKSAIKLGSVALNTIAPGLVHKRTFDRFQVGQNKNEVGQIFQENNQRVKFSLLQNAKEKKKFRTSKYHEATQVRQTSQIAKKLKTNFALQHRLNENRAYLERFQTKRREDEKKKKDKSQQVEAEAIETEEKRLRISRKYWDQKSTEFRNELSERALSENVQEPIERADVDLLCGEYQSGMFSHRQCVKQEMRRLKVMDEKAHEACIYGAYHNSTSDAKCITHKIMELRQKESDIVDEVVSIESAIANLCESYRQPFLREANAREIQLMHVLKEKLCNHRKSLNIIMEGIKKLLKEQRNNETHSNQLAKNIAVLKEDKRLAWGDLDCKSSTVASLPMVVGRHISSYVDPFLANPQETYEQITQLSNLMITRENIEKAVLLHRGSQSLRRTILGVHQKRQDDEEELESLERNRAHLETHKQSKDSIISVHDINRAVKRFWIASDNICHNPEFDSCSNRCAKTANGKNDVLTSNYVRTARSEEMNWDRQRTKLLTELFEAKKSDAEFWDSGLFLGSFAMGSRKNKEERNRICVGPLTSLKTRNQHSANSGASNGLFRYERKTFIDMILRELLAKDKNCEMDGTVSMRVQSEPAHVTKSNVKYITRKRAKYCEAVKSAGALEGCIIELLGDEKITVDVKITKIVWVENGIAPKIRHMVKKIDTRNGLLGDKEKLINLSGTPYFIVDDERSTARKNRESESGCKKNANCCNAIVGHIRIALDELDKYTWGMPRPLCGSTAARTKRSISHWSNVEEVCWSRPLRLQRYYEKERWEIKQLHSYFYDADTPSYLQRINFVHEIDKFEYESEFGEEMSLRIEDVKRRAAFHDFTNFISRINCFRLKIQTMEKTRNSVHKQFVKINKTLNSLQKDVSYAEKSIDNIGNDFHKASQYLDELRISRLLAAKIEEDLAASHLLKLRTSRARQGIEIAAKTAESEATLSRERLESVHKSLAVETRKTHVLYEKLELLNERYIASTRDWNEAVEDRELIRLQRRGCIMHTPFGLGKVLSFREFDGFLCVSLKFGVPRQCQGTGTEARLYTHIEECAILQRNRRNVSIARMQYEDELSQLYIRNDRMRSLNECKLMSNEDYRGRDILTGVEVVEIEHRIVDSYYKVSVDQSISFIQCAEGRQELGQQLDAAFKREENDRLLKAKNWDGEGNRPVPLQKWEHVPLRQKLKRQLKAAFVQELIKEEMANAHIDLGKERMQRISAQVANDTVNKVIQEMTAVLLKDAVSVDRKLKMTAEKSSGIIFTTDPYISFDEYKMQLRAWESRKNELQSTLNSWALSSGQPLGTRPSSNQRQKNAEDWKEENRQIICCKQMLAEETLRRIADREEMKRSLRERKLMFAEEQLMRLFVEQEEKLKREAVIQIRTLASPTLNRINPTEKESRRTQLKKNMVERHRIKRELDIMSQEDQLAHCLRTHYRKEEHMKLLEEEMKYDEECIDSVFFDNAMLHETHSKDKTSASEKMNEIGAAHWKKRWDYAIANVASHELDMMEIDEGLKACKKEVLQNQFHTLRICCEISKVTRESFNKGRTSVELRFKNNALVTADNEAERAIRDNERIFAERRISLDRIEDETTFMDSAALTNFPQRWETKKLRAHLQQPFFSTLVDYIVTSAEVKAMRNLLSKVATSLNEHDAAISQKHQQMKVLRNKHRRQQFMRMKRSRMQIFCQCRRKVITRTMRAWNEFTKWKLGHKRLYKLQYSGILRSMTDAQEQERRIL